MGFRPQPESTSRSRTSSDRNSTPDARAAPDADAEATSTLFDDAAEGGIVDERDGKPDDADDADALLAEAKAANRLDVSERPSDRDWSLDSFRLDREMTFVQGAEGGLP
ncbi:uncharacterized protein SCHCODRAFT_01097110 [Schizophyllum commune H4-8]|nr:uncharacterized protein SCHCODRAFT_01097110 [Schizophyllum commune H4-8]KAI5891728.1 hypothetical protein SCHCODRAFT_01097110 [Schizophyllum commune H4-8]